MFASVLSPACHAWWWWWGSFKNISFLLETLLRIFLLCLLIGGCFVQAGLPIHSWPLVSSSYQLAALRLVPASLTAPAILPPSKALAGIFFALLTGAAIFSASLAKAVLISPFDCRPPFLTCQQWLSFDAPFGRRP